jgi:DNA polymerase V
MTHKSRLQETLPLFEAGVKAGFPSPAEDEMGAPLNLHTYLIPHPTSTFFVRAVGDSMTGAGIFSGDLLIVDRSLTASHGKIVIALLNGQFTVKRLIIDKETICLKAENPLYPPIYIQKEEELTLWGVVTYVIHKP